MPFLGGCRSDRESSDAYISLRSCWLNVDVFGREHLTRLQPTVDSGFWTLGGKHRAGQNFPLDPAEGALQFLSFGQVLLVNRTSHSSCFVFRCFSRATAARRRQGTAQAHRQCDAGIGRHAGRSVGSAEARCLLYFGSVGLEQGKAFSPTGADAARMESKMLTVGG